MTARMSVAGVWDGGGSVGDDIDVDILPEIWLSVPLVKVEGPTLTECSD